MIRAGIVGLGKMGLSHYAIINSHPDVQVLAVCDSSSYLLGVLKQRSPARFFYTDYRTMIDEQKLDCVIVSTPTITHTEIAKFALERNIHVFVEKPFCLDMEDGRAVADLARQRGLVNQVGYHNRFVGAFNEVKRLVDSFTIGDVYHFSAEAYGPVVLRTASSTWRAKRSQGGGCLSDYASHIVNLVIYLFGVPSGVSGTILKRVFSREVEDAVYSTMIYEDGRDGQLSVNWSDDAYRKMTSRITLWGTRGKIFADRQECRIYVRDAVKSNRLEKGWNVRNTTELTAPVDFYLRGEEYSAQLWYFVRCIKERQPENTNSFESALHTDEVIALLRQDGERRNLH